jgi:hypothetical protein
MQDGDLLRLPGGELVEPGLRDIEAGRVTPEACLAWIAEPTLARARLFPTDVRSRIVEPERALYSLLCRRGGDAYPAYRALLLRLVSFERALRQMMRAENGSVPHS